MSYEYYKLNDDGALWKCEECKERKKHTEVILIPVKDGWKLLCKECVCEDWMANAKCIGTK